MVSAEVVASRKIRVLKTNMAKAEDEGNGLGAEIEFVNCSTEQNSESRGQYTAKLLDVPDKERTYDDYICIAEERLSRDGN